MERGKSFFQETSSITALKRSISCISEKAYLMFSIIVLSDRMTNLSFFRIKRMFVRNGSLFIKGVAQKRGGL